MKRSKVKLQSLKINKSDKTSGSDLECKEDKPKDELNTKKYNIWREKDILELIAAVEKRPVLWSDEFRNSEQLAKIEAWKEVSKEINNVNPMEVKRKWRLVRRNLTHSFKINTVSKWTKYLAFLGNGKSNLKTFEKSPVVEISDNSETDDYHSKRPSCTQTALALGNVSSSTPCVPTTNTSEAVQQTPDPISTFCEYLLAELNTLSDVNSRQLRKQLMQVVYNFEDTLVAQPTARRSNYY